MSLLSGYGKMAFRGLLRSRRYSQSAQPHFVGARVIIQNPKWLSTGKNVVISSDTKIDSYSANGIRIGDRVTIGSFSSLLATTVVREPGTGISIGSDSAIGIRNTLWGQGGLIIGKNCLLGPDVVIITENHSFASLSEPIMTQLGSRDAVVIEDDCWLGAGVKVLAGVTIGTGAVVGAGAVVTKSIPPYSIAVGVPAKIVGTRK